MKSGVEEKDIEVVKKGKCFAERLCQPLQEPIESEGRGKENDPRLTASPRRHGGVTHFPDNRIGNGVPDLRGLSHTESRTILLFPTTLRATIIAPTYMGETAATSKRNVCKKYPWMVWSTRPSAPRLWIQSQTTTKILTHTHQPEKDTAIQRHVVSEEKILLRPQGKVWVFKRLCVTNLSDLGRHYRSYYRENE